MRAAALITVSNLQSQLLESDSQEPNIQEQRRTPSPAAALTTSCVLVKRKPETPLEDQTDSLAAPEFNVNLSASTSAVSDLCNQEATVSLTRIPLLESEYPFYSFNISRSLLPIAISMTNPAICTT